MNTMKLPLLIFLILLTIFNLVIQALVATHLQDGKLDVKSRLQLLNKPAKKSFLTKHGDIVDCVEINKQLASDHPLLKNHSIQMKPSFSTTNVTKLTTTNEGQSSIFLPNNMRCPKGTVPVRRIQEEDLALEKFKPTFGISSSNVSNDYNGHQVAGLIGTAKHTAVYGIINVWNPTPNVKPGQYSAVSLYTASDDGDVRNTIQAGWMVNPSIYGESTTRLFTYWTKDSGKSTGCYDILCPGFVQTSQKIFLGGILMPVSIVKGDQRTLDVKVQQDIESKHWWLNIQGENVGYWPKELFSTLTDAAWRAGWGAEIFSQQGEEAPGMGSGWQAVAALGRACFLKNLQVVNPDLFPKRKNLEVIMSDHHKYTVYVNPDHGEDKWGHSMFVGGPSARW